MQKAVKLKFEDPISPVHMQILRFVIDNENVTMKDIATLLNITPPSATSMINTLVKLQLIKRKTHTTDRRQILIETTTKGKKELSRRMNEFYQFMEELCSKLTKNELKQFLTLYKKLLT